MAEQKRRIAAMARDSISTGTLEKETSEPVTEPVLNHRTDLVLDEKAPNNAAKVGASPRTASSGLVQQQNDLSARPQIQEELQSQEPPRNATGAATTTASTSQTSSSSILKEKQAIAEKRKTMQVVNTISSTARREENVSGITPPQASILQQKRAIAERRNTAKMTAGTITPPQPRPPTMYQQKQAMAKRHKVVVNATNGGTRTTKEADDVTTDSSQLITAVGAFAIQRTHVSNEFTVTNAADVELEQSYHHEESTKQIVGKQGDEELQAEAIVAELVTPPNLVSANVVDTTKSESHVTNLRRRIMIIVILALVIIAALVGGLVGALNNGSTLVTNSPSVVPSDQPSFQPTPLASQAPTTADFQLVFRSRLLSLIQSRSPATLFENSTSPQSLALDWMVKEDELSGIVLTENRLIQRFVLVTLWYATGGSTTWSRNGRGWLNPRTDECEWNSGDFRTCDDNGFVTALTLRRAGLSASLPIEIGLLSTLTFLDLDLNQLTGTLPTELGTLMALDTSLSLDMDFSRNQFTGTMPTELGQLTALTRLDLSENDLIGTVPQLERLTNLEILLLFNNSLTGTVPELLCNTGNIDVFGGPFRPRVECGKIACSCCADRTGNSC